MSPQLDCWREHTVITTLARSYAVEWGRQVRAAMNTGIVTVTTLSYTGRDSLGWNFERQGTRQCGQMARVRRAEEA
jgi:hypothetical protein